MSKEKEKEKNSTVSVMQTNTHPKSSIEKSSKEVQKNSY